LGNKTVNKQQQHIEGTTHTYDIFKSKAVEVLQWLQQCAEGGREVGDRQLIEDFFLWLFQILEVREKHQGSGSPFCLLLTFPTVDFVVDDVIVDFLSLEDFVCFVLGLYFMSLKKVILDSLDPLPSIKAHPSHFQGDGLYGSCLECSWLPITVGGFRVFFLCVSLSVCVFFVFCFFFCFQHQ
jgi:hypothetical protein